MKRTAHANWSGTFQEGKGQLTTQSQTLKDTSYSFKTRVDENGGTNPEELLAAAHAGCYTMAISYALTEAGFTPNDLHTDAILDFDLKTLSITSIHLKLTASRIENLRESRLIEIAEKTKNSCVISRALSVPISLEISY